MFLIDSIHINIKDILRLSQNRQNVHTRECDQYSLVTLNSRLMDNKFH